MTTVTIEGVTFNINDNSSGSGVSADDVKKVLENAATQPAFKNMLKDLAASPDPAKRVIALEIDKPGADSGTFNTGSGEYGINIVSHDVSDADLLGWGKLDQMHKASQPNELYSLSDLLISSINLGFSNVDYYLHDNHITQESSFVINGNSHQIADVRFKYSDVWNGDIM